MQPVSVNASQIRTEGASVHSHRLTWWETRPGAAKLGCLCSTPAPPLRGIRTERGGDQRRWPLAPADAPASGALPHDLPNPGAKVAIITFMLTEETKAQTVSVCCVFLL